MPSQSLCLTRWGLAGLLCVLVAGCSGATPATTSRSALPAVTPSSVPAGAVTPSAIYWPTAGWRASAPEAQGMDTSTLAKMLDHIHQQSLSLHSLLVIRHGYMVSETYFGAYRQDTRHQLYSCTKSFIATLVGIAVDQGYIAQTSHRVLDYFPRTAFDNPADIKSAMTLDDLLTMRSGLHWLEGDPAYQAMYRSSDWVRYVLDEPMAQPPGTQFNYCSGCSHVLSAIVQQATGTNTRDYADKNLFQPLGITNIQWDTDAAGTPIGGWGLYLTPRDMAKLGYLYLHEGQWDGKQVVSSAWVKAATQKHTAADDSLGYGYQWWIYPTWDAYAALGREGQTIFVIPGADLVIVTTAGLNNHDEIFKLIEDYIYPAVVD